MRLEQTNKEDNSLIDEPVENIEKTDPIPKQIVIIFQLAICVAIAIALFIIKYIGGSLYENIKEYYLTNINNSVITEFNLSSGNDFASTLADEN